MSRKRRDSDPETSERAAAVASGAASTGGGGGGGGAAATVEKSGSLEIIPESCPLDPNGRLSISLDDHNVSSPSSCGSHPHHVSMRGARGVDFRAQTSAVHGGPADQAVLRGEDGGTEMKSYTACLPQVRLSKAGLYFFEALECSWVVLLLTSTRPSGL